MTFILIYSLCGNGLAEIKKAKSPRKFKLISAVKNININKVSIYKSKLVTLTHTSSVGHWADSGLDFAEPALSSCSGQTPEVAALPPYWQLHLRETETQRDNGIIAAEREVYFLT